MRNTKQYAMRGFHIISDAAGHFRPVDAICQFEYKGHQVSVSTAGLSQGGCQNEVKVFGGEKREDELHQCHTVQEAIEYIDAL